MKNPYIEKMYDDFNIKVETILKYLHTLEEGTTETTKFLAQYVSQYEKLYTIMQQSKQQNKIPNDTQFAIEHQPIVNIPNSIDDIKEISNIINSSAPMVEYKFEEILRNLQFLTQSFQNYQDLTNKILEAWNGMIETSQE